MKTLTKSIIYRFYSMFVTMIVSFILTGNVIAALTIGFFDSLVKIFTYYGFDTVWNKLFNKKIKPGVILFTGLSGAGKTTIGQIVQEELIKKGQKVIMLDGDELRKFFPNTGFDEESRKKHNMNLGYMASYFESQGTTCLLTIISPYREIRDKIRENCKSMVEIYVNTPINTCEQRDPKGLYKKVRAGEIKQFTGIHDDAPYEAPLNPELILDTLNSSPQDCAKEVLKLIWKN